jgi:uncharacterized membrane protein
VIGGEEKTSAAVPIVAFVAVLASIVLYRQLQTGAFKSIQLASTLAQIAQRGREVIDGLYVLEAPPVPPIEQPDSVSAASASEQSLEEIVWRQAPAVVQIIDVPRVLRAAQRAQVVIHFKVGSGEMVAEGAALAAVRGPAHAGLEREVLKAVTVGEERTFEQDPVLAIRLLADIGLRALSPAVNDPSTAVQALDTMDGLLRVLATRDLGIGQIPAGDGAIRVELVLPTWDDYLAAAFDEIIALRARSPSVSRRILRLLDDLAAIAPSSRRSVLESRRRRIQDPDPQSSAD